MDERLCLEKQLKWNNFSFYGDRLSGKFTPGINIAKQSVWENHLGGTETLIRLQVAGQLTLDKWLKKNTVKPCTKSSKKETTSKDGTRCSFDQKTKKLSKKKQVWTGFNHIKAATCFSEKLFFNNCSQPQQLTYSSHQRTQPMG